VPVDPFDLLPPPPTWKLPVELEASFPPLPPTATGSVTVVVVVPSGIEPKAVGVACGPADWMLPAESEALLPPPTCTLPLELLAELPLPGMPAGALTPADWPPAPPVADG
jgi:hypothetical protein